VTRLLAVVGAVTPPGRLDAAVRFAADRATEQPQVSATVLRLGEHRLSFADGRPLDRYPDDTARVVGAIAEADAVLLASPVYRASFTGALKNLLDLTPVEALRAKPVGIVAMGATLHHYLGVDWQLRAVLAWFGALVVPTSVYLESGHFQDGKLADPIARLITGSGLGSTGALLLLFAILLVVGMFLDGVSIFLIFIPLLMPVALAYGWDVVWFGVILTLAVAIGQFTPPMAVNLMVACKMAGVSMERTVPWVLWLVTSFMFAALLVILMPPLATWLPRSLGY